MKKIFYSLVLLPILVFGQTPTQSENYIWTKSYKVPSTTSISNPTVNQVSQVVTYYDGLGRPIQKVENSQTHLGKNVITPISYDQYGRVEKEYLPYSTQTNNLEYVPTALNDVMTYYNTSTYQNTANPFNRIRFEESPLDRVMEKAAPGNDWNMDNATNHTLKYEYLLNGSNEVKVYKATSTYNDTNKIFNVTLTSDGTSFYNPNLLYKTIIKNENWKPADLNNNTVEEFKNMEGQLLLKRAYGVSIVNGVETNTTHDTYYVYDQFGNLSYVIPPLVENNVLSQLDELCYQYKYDRKNRLTEKKLPGKQWEFIVYDKLNRVVASGPALSPFSDPSLEGTYGWLITKYDVYNRVIITAWLNTTPATSTGRRDLQITQNVATVINETKSPTNNSVNGVAYRYTNSAWPTIGYHVLTIEYYDDYTTNLTFSPAISYTAIYGQTLFNNTAGNKPIGLQTVSWVRVPETISLYKAEKGYTFYDQKGRVIRSFSNNYLGGYTQVDNQIESITGRINYNVTTHKRLSTSTVLTTRDDYSYTAQDRLLIHTNMINALPAQTISYNDYDELGKLKSKSVGGFNTNLQIVNFTYNVRGWLTHINKPGRINVDGPIDLFNFKINYNTVEDQSEYASTALFNGNISETYWRTETDLEWRKYSYKYDNLNRLKEAIYLKPGNTNPIPFSYNETVMYDKNSNIKKLDRNGDLEDVSPANKIDELTFDYQSNTNKLIKVTDATPSATSGFNDASNIPIEYIYDLNGNMKTDSNKGITSIIYNHLDLPTKINFGASNYIHYFYNARGDKVKKIVNQNGTITTTDYLDGYQYKNTVLEFFPHAEGYIKGDFKYVFQYKDHLGNIRLSYSDTNGDDIVSSSEIIEENHYYPFGLKHSGYNNNVTTINSANNYKYNGKELQTELNLNFYDYGARNYDPAIGRWMNIDPLAEKSRRYSPYTYALNNPIYFIDPDGMLPRNGGQFLNDGRASSTDAADGDFIGKGGYYEYGQGAGIGFDDDGSILISGSETGGGETGGKGDKKKVNGRTIRIDTKSKRASFLSTPTDGDFDTVYIDGVEKSTKIGKYTEESLDKQGYMVFTPYANGMTTTDFGIMFTGTTLAFKAIGYFWASRYAGSVLPRSGPIIRSLGAGSRAEMLAKKFNMNINSPTTRQVLNSLDDTVESFISNFRKSSIRSEIPGGFLEQTVEQALRSGNTTVRKFLTDGRFIK